MAADSIWDSVVDQGGHRCIEREQPSNFFAVGNPLNATRKFYDCPTYAFGDNVDSGIMMKPGQLGAREVGTRELAVTARITGPPFF